MSGWDDDDDWVGTPPEGHHTRDQAKPEFWLRQRPATIASGVLGILVIIVIVLIAVLR
jgi:hypothetical protein